MTNTEKILEECRKKFGGKVGWIGAGGAPGGNLTGLADKEIELFLSTKIAQALAEDRERVRGEIKAGVEKYKLSKQVGNMAGDYIFTYDLETFALSSLDKPLTDK